MNDNQFHKSLEECMKDNYLEISKLEWLLEMVKCTSIKHFSFEPKVISGETPMYCMEIQFGVKEG